MLGILLGAAVLGVIIAVMEDGEFPGWFVLVACWLATILPAALVTALLPPELHILFLGPLVGALTGGCAISALCGMTLKRASIAAGIFLVFQIGLEVTLHVLMSK